MDRQTKEQYRGVRLCHPSLKLLDCNQKKVICAMHVVYVSVYFWFTRKPVGKCVGSRITFWSVGEDRHAISYRNCERDWVTPL